MRDVDTIDQELRLNAVTRAALRDMGVRLSTRQVDELLDERNTVTPGQGRSGAEEIGVLNASLRPCRRATTRINGVKTVALRDMGASGVSPRALAGIVRKIGHDVNPGVRSAACRCPMPIRIRNTAAGMRPWRDSHSHHLDSGTDTTSAHE